MKKKLLSLLFLVLTSIGFSQNNYLDFDGINDFVNVANSGNLLSNSTAITMSCKVFPKNATPSFPSFNGFAGYRNESNFDFYLIQLTATQVEARFRNSSGTAFTALYNGLVLNQWNHLFLVYNGSTLKIYSGASEVASVAASGTVPASNSSTFKIGNVIFSTYNFYHKGYIDEVSLWNKALTASEIATIINNDGEINEPDAETNLKVYYKFNQGNAYGANSGLTTLIDEQGLQNGTLTNFALTGNTSNWGSEDLASNSFSKATAIIYPNPVLNSLQLTNYTEITDIEIVDIRGRKVLSQKVSGASTVNLDVSHLSAGIYLAQVNGNQFIKFIKQ